MDRTKDQPLTSAANADDFAPYFGAITRGVLNEGVVKIPTNDNKTDEIWLGSINIDGTDDVAVYLRMSGKRQMMAELVCAVLGRAIGLPIPLPFIVTVDRKKIPRSKLWASMEKGQKQCVMFASAAIEGKGNFTQLMQGNSDYAKRLIQTWDQYPEAAIFDELLANVDRNYSNMLFRANIIWLIDHAEAFGGISGSLFPLDEIAGDSFKNQLLDDFKADFTLPKRAKILAIAKEMLQQIQQFDLNEMLQSIGDEHISADGGIAEVLNFLETRLLHTVPLICHRLDIPQLPLPSQDITPCLLPEPATTPNSANKVAAAPPTLHVLSAGAP